MTTIQSDYFPLKKETGKIISAAIEVHRTLGFGFLEVVYKDALELEFQIQNIVFEREKPYQIKYNDVVLRHKFISDFVVFDTVILEVKAKAEIANDDMARTINYLKCSGCEVGLILNFGRETVQIKRVVL